MALFRVLCVYKCRDTFSYITHFNTLLKEIHRKYYELLRLDNGIMLDLKTNIKNKYNVKMIQYAAMVK